MPPLFRLCRGLTTGLSAGSWLDEGRRVPSFFPNSKASLSSSPLIQTARLIKLPDDPSAPEESGMLDRPAGGGRHEFTKLFWRGPDCPCAVLKGRTWLARRKACASTLRALRPAGAPFCIVQLLAGHHLSFSLPDVALSGTFHPRRRHTFATTGIRRRFRGADVRSGLPCFFTVHQKDQSEN